MTKKDDFPLRHSSRGAGLMLAAALSGVLFGTIVAVPNAFAAAPTVDITKFAFTPGELTVAPGTTVVWTNHDEVPHTVASKDKRLTSKALDTDDRFEHTFDEEGDFAYYCTLHPFMTGVVHVRKP